MVQEEQINRSEILTVHFLSFYFVHVKVLRSFLKKIIQPTPTVLHLPSDSPLGPKGSSKGEFKERAYLGKNNNFWERQIPR